MSEGLQAAFASTAKFGSRSSISCQNMTTHHVMTHHVLVHPRLLYGATCVTTTLAILTDHCLVMDGWTDTGP